MTKHFLQDIIDEDENMDNGNELERVDDKGKPIKLELRFSNCESSI